VIPAPRFRHGWVALFLTVGLLAMHGLTSAGPAGEHSGPAIETTAASSSEVHRSMDHSMGHGRHHPFHDIGEACLWLLAGGALLVVARHIRRAGTHFAEIASRDPIARPPLSPQHHPPDPRLATIALRC